MVARVFCIGNGESRKSIDLIKLREHGKIYGCNALYRDFTPDVLIAVDQGIMHEIYHSGYCQKNQCYFRNWSKVPAQLYDTMIKSGASNDDYKFAKEENIILENERGDAEEFVMHGSNVKGIVTIIKQNNSKEKKNIHQNSIKVSWIQKNDKSNCINDILTDNDKGWAAGATATYIACIKEEPEEVYLIGHDLNSTTGKVNNLYKGSKNYVLPDHNPTPSVNWVSQLKQTFYDFSGRGKYRKIKFFKVQESIRGSDMVNRVVPEWTDHKGNLEYMTYKDFYKKFNL